MLFDIEDEEGCEGELNQKIKELMNANIRMEDETKKMIEKMEVLESNLKVNDT